MSFKDEPEIKEARSYIDRALGGILTLHIGPLDYNAGNTADALLAAARCVEEFERRRSREQR